MKRNMNYMKRAIYIVASIMMFVNIHLTAQMGVAKFTVSGSVTDAATHKAIPGAQVDVEGIASAITDDEGKYTIKLPIKETVLKVKADGYDLTEVSVRGRDLINIVLYEENYKGAAKSVLTPLGEQSAIKNVYSWFGITEDNLASNAVTPDALLKTQASGLNVVSRSGTPSSGSNFYLHGLNTMYAGSMPFIIVDGMPYENTNYATSLVGNYFANPLSSIDVKDIESITVLKDGTSIYGSKGANGVILIKTLQAKSLETRINAKVSTGVGFSTDELPLLNSMDHKLLLSELYQKAYPGISPDILNSSLPFLNQTKPVKEAWGYEGNVDYFRYNAATDWQKEVLGTSFNNDVYLNVSGGDEVATYVLSLGYLNKEGMVKNTDFSRFNTRFNSTIKFSKKFKVFANMSFMYGTKHLPNEDGNVLLNPILASLVKAPFTSPFIYNEEGKRSPNLEDADIWNLSNPYVLVNNKENLVNINYRFFGSFKFEYNFNKYLDFVAQFGLNFNKEREKAFYSGTGIAFTGNVDNVGIFNNSLHRVDRLFSIYGDAYANYKNNFDFDHSLNIRTGVRYQDNSANNNFGESFNSSSDEFKSLQYGASSLRVIGGSINDWSWRSLYTTVDYGYKSKYFVNLNSSFDASSRFGINVGNMLPFYSVGASWLVSNEEFMKDNSGIDLLKVRASYGLSGNDDIGNYNGDRYYYPYALVGQYGLVRTSLVNTDIKPETMARTGLGVDLSILKERLNINLDLYSNTVSDMILNVKPASISGAQSDVVVNTGKMNNVGLDLNLNARVINTKSFKWDLGLMVSTYKNKVLDLGGNDYYNQVLGATVQSKVGQSMGVFYGYQTDGVYSTTAEAQADGLNIREGLVLIPFGAGDMRFVNQNSDNIIDDNDRVVIGDPNPDFFGNVNTTLTYNQFQLSAVFNYSIGGDVYNYSRSLLEGMSGAYNQSQAVLNRWRYEGDITTIPQATPGDPMGNARFSDRWIEDGSYIRLKNVSLSYDLKLRTKFIQSSVVYLNGENLLTFTNYKGLDPEFALGNSPLYMGIDPCVAPQTPTVTVGLRLGL